MIESTQNELTAEEIIHIFENSQLQGSFTQEGLTAAYVAALAALRAEQERNKGCEWCNTELRFECYLIDDDGYTASIENNVVQTIIADYCPVCGRRLTEGRENND